VEEEVRSELPAWEREEEPGSASAAERWPEVRKPRWVSEVEEVAL